MTPLALWSPKNYTPEVRNVGFINYMKIRIRIKMKRKGKALPRQ